MQAVGISRIISNFLVVVLGLAAGSLLTGRLFDFGTSSLYVVGSDRNIVPAGPDEFGLAREEALFVAMFRGEFGTPADDVTSVVKDNVRTVLLDGYSRVLEVLDRRTTFASDRERFIAYLMLRVNGSLPTFNSERPIPKKPADLLFSRDGNCGHQTYRLLMLLDLFSIKGRAYTWYSPSIEGHVFAGAYDPVGKRSYFLDPTSNLMASASSPAEDVDFLDMLAPMNSAARESFLRSRLLSFPAFYERAIGIDQDFRVWSEDNFLRSRDAVISGLAYELPIVMAKWKSGQVARPASLCEMARSQAHGMQEFLPANCLPTVPAQQSPAEGAEQPGAQ